MRQTVQQLVDEGYVGELFPFVVEGNHGSEVIACDLSEDFILCHECEHDHDPEGCPDDDKVIGICRHYSYRKACLFSECNLWRWFNFEVLEGNHNWVMT